MRVHFLGIGGSGESAVAAIAKAFGYEISGCDKDLSSEFLKPLGDVQISQGHSASHIGGGELDLAGHPKGGITITDLLIITPAILSLDPNNPELEEARKLNIPILTWQEFLGQYLLKEKYVIAVAGTHGKTTTTAMIAQILEDGGLDPTVELGAINPKWSKNLQQGSQFSHGSNCRVGKSKYFVVEADEFNNNFLNYKPDLSVITNIEFDHPEFFRDFEEYKISFRKFIDQTKQKVFVNKSDATIQHVILSSPSVSLSESEGSNLDSSAMPKNDKITDFSNHIIGFPLKVPGDFNKLNASAAFQVGLALNIDPSTIRKSLMNYSGVGRRFELVGEFKGAKIFSDFAHHPTEIKVTLETAREKFPVKKIWVIFQPHMFSRTLSLFDDFVEVFQNLPVDKVVILDIYPSREVDTGYVSSKQLVEAIKKPNTKYTKSYQEALDELNKSLTKEDVVFFLGAGDTHILAKKLSGIT